MFTKFSQIALSVLNYDDALEFYVDKLGFVKVTDRELAPGIRWVAVAPKGDNETVVTFIEATTPEERAFVGKQIQGMTLFLETDDLDGAYRTLRQRGVEFTEAPTTAPWGKQAVLKDLYGNLIDLLQSGGD